MILTLTWRTVALLIVAFALALVLACRQIHATALQLPEVPHPRYLVIGPDVPSDVLVCVPLEIESEAQHFACLPVDAIRWFIRSQRQS
jgi:hypothetical protein